MTHTIQDLRIRQALPLEQKILMTKTRIREWVNYYGLEGVYVSFSGGKDSTVLLHIARSIYPDIKAVFVDTGLEYPEIRDFVKTFDNVDIIRPKMNFKQVLNKYGYPIISKEVSECVYGAKKYLTSLTEAATITKTDRQTDRQTAPYAYRIADLLGIERRTGDLKDYQALKAGTIPKLPPIRYRILTGTLIHKEKGKTTNEFSKRYDKSKYKFFLDAPFEISGKCCNVMKKAPAHDYQKRTGRKPIIATLAEESMLRTEKWLKQGCNGFEAKDPTSTPLSFWREQDVLKYIRENNIKIASVYGEIVPDYSKSEEIDGQIDISELGLIKDNRCYKTTGCKRTGCMFCLFGITQDKSPNRLERMKITHPKQYDYIMRPKEQGGLGYKEVIDWINANSDLNIKY